ncbi:hypothetical protein BLNAU_16269 [Blattamonas nauphoetae]|uniref:Uncharacterized protein n=1 Tax=Blattamonas nauphoetae TaxID=2049346 RepID=A0ABQ9XD74_9EUKA|nr:hypothetical protein BLNAU_16269 [Blattamonas nauphoetae]
MDGVEGDDSQSPFASSRTSPRQHRRRLPQQPGDDIEKTPSTQMGMSGRPRPRHMHYWQHPSMRDQNYNSDEFYPIIVESLAHQYPPRQQQPTYNQQVLVFEDVQADVPSQEFPMTIRSLMHSQQEQAEDTRLPPLYSDDVMTYPLHSHVKALENRNKHEHPPDKVNDVQNPLVDSGRVVVAFPDQQKYFSPFLSQNEHSTVRLQAKRYAKQKPDSLSNREENQPFDEEYATSRANQLTERDFSGSFALPPTYTNQKQSETTHQSEPISHQRYPQEDIHHFTQPSFYKPQSSTSLLSSHVLQLPSSCPQRTHFEVANTREEGSDGEKAGERAEKVAADFQSLVDYYDDLDIINQLWKNSDILSNKMEGKISLSLNKKRLCSFTTCTVSPILSHISTATLSISSYTLASLSPTAHSSLFAVTSIGNVAFTTTIINDLTSTTTLFSITKSTGTVTFSSSPFTDCGSTSSSLIDATLTESVSKTATTAAGQLSITVTVNSDATCRTITLSVDSAFTETSETLTLTKMDSWPCQAARSPLSSRLVRSSRRVQLQMEELSRSVTGGQLSITSTIFSDSSATANGAALFLDPSGLTASYLTSLLPRTSMYTVHPHWNSNYHNMHVTVNVISRRTPPTPVSKLMPQLFLVNEDAASSIAVRFLLAVILLVRQYLNTQRITHVVICGTGTTFLASPAKHVSRVCSFLDKALDGDGVILLVSGACDGSDVAEPADSDEGIVRIVHSAQHVVQPGSATGSVCAECAYCSESEVPLLTGAWDGASGIDSAVRRCEETPNAAEVGENEPASFACRPPLTSACRTYTPLGLDVPQINVQNVPAQLLGHATILELMEAGNRNCQLFGQSNKTPSDGKDRPGTTPERHARPPTLSQVSSAASLDSLASSSRVDSPTTSCRSSRPHRTPLRRQRTATQTALAPRRPHSQTPFASEGPRELERATESCSCDDAPVLAREWDALAATLEASPKVGLAPHNPSHTLPLFPITRKCAFCECEEDNTDNIRREGEGCGCEAEAPFLIVSPIGLGGSAVVVRSLSFARHHLAVLFCAESRSASQNMFTEEQIVVPDRVVPVCTDLSTSSH